jgi:hypothetical protein
MKHPHQQPALERERGIESSSTSDRSDIFYEQDNFYFIGIYGVFSNDAL